MSSKIDLKKIIIILLKICIALVLFITLNKLFMPKYIEENQDGRLTSEYYKEKGPVDVIITGSSLVYNGVSPMTMYENNGICAYNRSNPSQTIAISYYMIEEAIKCNKPKLVIADVGFIYEAADYVDEGSSRKTFDGMHFNSSKINGIKASISENENFIDYIFPILRFHSRWKELKNEDFKYLFYKPVVTHNGQILSFDRVSDYIEYRPYDFEENITACDENMAYLQKICDICKENDVQLLFVKLPCLQGKWNHTMDIQVKELAEKNGIIYKNFIEEYENIALNSMEDFSDTQHMNAYGAEKFTKALSEYIIEKYDIPDRRAETKINEIYYAKLKRYKELIQ